MGILDGNLYENMRIILPEHRKAMLHMEIESKRVVKPTLDQDKLEEISRTLAEAIFNSRLIHVTIYKPFGAEVVEMVPLKIDPYQRLLKGIDTDNESITIKLNDLLDVRL